MSDISTPTSSITVDTSGLQSIDGPATVDTSPSSSTLPPACVVFAADGFCLQWSTDSTAIVAVGTPPTLPHTGGSPAPVASLGLLFVVLGALAVRAVRRPC